MSKKKSIDSDYSKTEKENKERTSGSNRKATLVLDGNGKAFNVDADPGNADWLAELRKRQEKQSHKMISKLAIDIAVANFLIKVIREPLIYFSEADLQQSLVEELRKIKVLSKSYPTKVQRGQNSESVYRTSLVHREYGGGQGSRIDAVIFDERDVFEIDDINLTRGNKYLAPLFSFELGTEKTFDTMAHLVNDIKKLANSKETGYLIHIYRDKTKAKSGTRSRRKTEERIKSRFKEVFSKYEANPKIKILAILLRIYRKQSRIVGKCEICCGAEWNKININDKEELRKTIMGELR